MPYITSVERANLEKGRKMGREEGLERGLEQGLERGRVEALHLAITRVLASRFGDIPKDLDETLRSITSAEQLTELIAQAATAETTEQMRTALARVRSQE